MPSEQWSLMVMHETWLRSQSGHVNLPPTQDHLFPQTRWHNMLSASLRHSIVSLHVPCDVFVASIDVPEVPALLGPHDWWPAWDDQPTSNSLSEMSDDESFTTTTMTWSSPVGPTPSFHYWRRSSSYLRSFPPWHLCFECGDSNLGILSLDACPHTADAGSAYFSPVKNWSDIIRRRWVTNTMQRQHGPEALLRARRADAFSCVVPLHWFSQFQTTHRQMSQTFWQSCGRLHHIS